MLEGKVYPRNTELVKYEKINQKNLLRSPQQLQEKKFDKVPNPFNISMC